MALGRTKEERKLDVETIESLKTMNYVMAVQSLVLAGLFWGPPQTFLRPTTPPDAQWLSLQFMGLEVWDFGFAIGGIYLIVATLRLRGIYKAHVFMGVWWFLLGFLWVVGGIFNAPSYLFGTGLFALFIAAGHVAIIRAWRAEGVQ